MCHCNDNYDNIDDYGPMMMMMIICLLFLLIQANHRILTYMKYSYLWTESRNDTMYYFLNWGRQLTPDELDMLNEDENLVS